MARMASCGPRQVQYACLEDVAIAPACVPQTVCQVGGWEPVYSTVQLQAPRIPIKAGHLFGPSLNHRLIYRLIYQPLLLPEWP